MKVPSLSVESQVERLECRRLLSAAGLEHHHDHHHGPAFVHETDLVTSGNAGSLPAQNTDSTLINPWGLASGPTTPFWVSDNGSGVATLYNGSGIRQGTPFVVPAATGSDASAPTGQVFAGGDGFIPDPTRPNNPALFIFVSEDGGISAWNPAFGHNAFLAVDHGNTDPLMNAVYKGVTIGDVGTTHFLYATNFRAGQVEVYNTAFQQVTVPGGFVDKKIPKGFAPFNIQSVGNDLFVTYAKQDDKLHDDVAGNGNGFVDEFNTQGMLVRRFDHGGFLNSPWAVAQIPNDGSWGNLGNDILVGNFGSGLIDVFSPDGDFQGFLHDDVTGHRVHIDGLWALRFGNGAAAGPTSTLFFTAGTAGESAGLFGSLTFSPQKTHHDTM